MLQTQKYRPIDQDSSAPHTQERGTRGQLKLEIPEGTGPSWVTWAETRRIPLTIIETNFAGVTRANFSRKENVI